MIAIFVILLLVTVSRLLLPRAILTLPCLEMASSPLLSSLVILLESLTLFPLRLVSSLTTTPTNLSPSSRMMATAIRPLS